MRIVKTPFLVKMVSLMQGVLTPCCFYQILHQFLFELENCSIKTAEKLNAIGFTLSLNAVMIVLFACEF